MPRPTLRKDGGAGSRGCLFPPRRNSRHNKDLMYLGEFKGVTGKTKSMKYRWYAEARDEEPPPDVAPRTGGFQHRDQIFITPGGQCTIIHCGDRVDTHPTPSKWHPLAADAVDAKTRAAICDDFSPQIKILMANQALLKSIAKSGPAMRIGDTIDENTGEIGTDEEQESEDVSSSEVEQQGSTLDLMTMMVNQKLLTPAQCAAILKKHNPSASSTESQPAATSSTHDPVAKASAEEKKNHYVERLSEVIKEHLGQDLAQHDLGYQAMIRGEISGDRLADSQILERVKRECKGRNLDTTNAGMRLAGLTGSFPEVCTDANGNEYEGEDDVPHPGNFATTNEAIRILAREFGYVTITNDRFGVSLREIKWQTHSDNYTVAIAHGAGGNPPPEWPTYTNHLTALPAFLPWVNSLAELMVADPEDAEKVLAAAWKLLRKKPLREQLYSCVLFKFYEGADLPESTKMILWYTNTAAAIMGGIETVGGAEEPQTHVLEDQLNPYTTLAFSMEDFNRSSNRGEQSILCKGRMQALVTSRLRVTTPRAANEQIILHEGYVVTNRRVRPVKQTEKFWKSSSSAMKATEKGDWNGGIRSWWWLFKGYDDITLANEMPRPTNVNIWMPPISNYLITTHVRPDKTKRTPPPAVPPTGGGRLNQGLGGADNPGSGANGDPDDPSKDQATEEGSGDSQFASGGVPPDDDLDHAEGDGSNYEDPVHSEDDDTAGFQLGAGTKAKPTAAALTAWNAEKEDKRAVAGRWKNHPLIQERRHENKQGSKWITWHDKSNDALIFEGLRAIACAAYSRNGKKLCFLGPHCHLSHVGDEVIATGPEADRLRKSPISDSRFEAIRKDFVKTRAKRYPDLSLDVCKPVLAPPEATKITFKNDTIPFVYGFDRPYLKMRLDDKFLSQAEHDELCPVFHIPKRGFQ